MARKSKQTKGANGSTRGRSQYRIKTRVSCIILTMNTTTPAFLARCLYLPLTPLPAFHAHTLREHTPFVSWGSNCCLRVCSYYSDSLLLLLWEARSPRQVQGPTVRALYNTEQRDRPCPKELTVQGSLQTALLAPVQAQKVC